MFLQPIASLLTAGQGLWPKAKRTEPVLHSQRNFGRNNCYGAAAVHLNLALVTGKLLGGQRVSRPLVPFDSRDTYQAWSIGAFALAGARNLVEQQHASPCGYLCV